MPESNRNTVKPPAVLVVCSQVIFGFMPFAQLVIGAVYQHDCPRQPYIPTYLLVMGVVSLLLSFLSILNCTAGFRNHSTIWSCLVAFFFFCWFIAGNVWIYSIYEPNYNKNTTTIDTYCNKTLYLFAFWSTTLSYIVFGLILFSTCCKILLCRGD